MKPTTLLVFGLTLLPLAVLADQPRISGCAQALEQLATLKTRAPLYQLTEAGQRRYIEDADRPAEIARLNAIVADSCSKEPEHKQREESEASQLHVARSPGCMQDRDRLAMMERKAARTPDDDLARTRNRVHAQCPDVGLKNVWLIEWIPPPSS